MTHSSAVLHSLAKLERLEPANKHHPLPPLPSSSAANQAAHGADVFSAPLHLSSTSLLAHHSRSSSLSLQTIRPRSPSAQSASPSHSPRAVDADGEDEEESRLHAQYRLKQRLKEKSRREASRHKRQQLMSDGSDSGRVEEDEEEREARLTSLAHDTMPPSPIIRTRSLRPSALSSTAESELPSVSPRTAMGELSVLHKQRQRVSGNSETVGVQCDDSGSEADVEMKYEAADSNAGAATPCFRVAKRLLQPTATQKGSGQFSRSDSLQSPLSYSSSPTVSSTLSTAAASPALSIPSITRSVNSHFANSPHSNIHSPYSTSSLPSPLPASPATLPSVLLHSSAMDTCTGTSTQQRASDSRPVAMFSRRNMT